MMNEMECCGGGCHGCDDEMESAKGGCCETMAEGASEACEYATVGRMAPHFRLEGVDASGVFHWYDLNDSRGKWVVLYSYPLDFTFICPTEISGYSARYEEFEKLNCQVFGFSTDSCHSHKAWIARDLGALKHPLLSDMTQEVSEAYGCLIPEKGHTNRATFIIDPTGKLRYAGYHDEDLGRSVDETLRLLSALQTGERCPANWKPGQQTLGKG